MWRSGLILEIKNAQVYRGDTCVFERLSFVLEEDHHTAILGPNGAGKSTILKLLAGEVQSRAQSLIARNLKP